MLFLSASCTKGKEPVTDAITNRDSVPVMVTRDVSTYISDSGVVRYKIIADEWQVFDRLDPSMWTFEQGVYLEKFNNDLSIEATIVADTAYYYDKKELWELRGNVHIENEQDEQFDTQLLFWDQKTKRVYSDLFIRIRQQKRIITGIGFISNQDFTRYTIKQTQGIFPIKEESQTDSTSLTTDTIAAPTFPKDTVTTIEEAKEIQN
ncbi:MAG: LPS export ABC transporter periplasmic protein LptC [Bacteroidaceae bacterium]|nr:LPS export ABC transporter periplasmic protein LptC [Bacteroidaceae bacterium]